MENQILFVTISPQPEVKLISIGLKRVVIGDDIYEEIGAGDSNGFYDFLRQPGRIIGLRFTPFVEFSKISDSSSPGPAMKITGISPTTTLELYWDRVREYDYSLSVDQFFDSNYIFKGALDRYAVTFGFSYLAENEIEGLLSAVAR
jgi:hypothetical protein